MLKLAKTDEYQDWFMGLSDKLVKSRIEARIDRLQEGNPGDVEPVGKGVSERRTQSLLRRMKAGNRAALFPGK